jgi:hypothetical protein
MNRLFGLAAAVSLLWELIKPFEKYEAYKLGILDRHGNLIRSPRTVAERNSYDALTRIAVNLKRLLAKVPGGESQIASLLAAMYLWREDTEDFDEKLVEQTAREPIRHYLANRSAQAQQSRPRNGSIEGIA